MLVKAVPTGRQAKEPEKRYSVTVSGVKLSVLECDTWDGPIPEGGRTAQYWRMTFIEQPKVEFP